MIDDIKAALDVLQKGLFGFALADKEQGAVLRAIRMSRRHYRLGTAPNAPAMYLPYRLTSLRTPLI